MYFEKKKRKRKKKGTERYGVGQTKRTEKERKWGGKNIGIQGKNME